MVIINTPPPIYEIAKLHTNGAVQIYALLFESAFKETNYDDRTHLPPDQRRDTGGTTQWTIKGIAEVLRLGKKTIITAIQALIDNGYISVAGFESSGHPSKRRIFRVTPVDQLDARRAALEIMGQQKLVDKKENKYSYIDQQDEFLDWLETEA